MDLCCDCYEFAIAIYKRTEHWSRPHAFWNEASLRSDSCRLCRMISDYQHDNASYSISSLGEQVRIFYSTFESAVAHRPLSCVRFRIQSGLEIKINVWSDAGSAAGLSGAVCDKQPLPSDNGSAAFTHINSWIQDCIRNHVECKYTISNNRVDESLPTRVLDLGFADNTDLSLIETQNERGKYCALSYCWGPPGMNHSLTTRANIKSHFNGIKFDQLPRTLQDAVIVTRQIGIRYLWVDSLCIIQRDKEDWTTQSAKMAEVYQNAQLVIAASGAAHPGEGCFSNKRRFSTSVEIPHFSEAGQTMGSIRLSMCVLGTDAPDFGPLQERGWALQERMLARRTLYFMPAGISWKCQELETGERYTYDIGEYPRWDTILQRFSDCQLTYKEDRLVALEGLRKAFQEASGDKYTFGIFESQLPELLLWAIEEWVDTSEDLVSVPTWSWASKGGVKTFWKTQGILGKSMINDAELRVEKSGALRIKGVLQECKVSNTELVDLEPADLHPIIGFGWDGKESLYPFEGTSAASSFLGIAVFDREFSETVHALFLNEVEHSDSVPPDQHPIPQSRTLSGELVWDSSDLAQISRIFRRLCKLSLSSETASGSSNIFDKVPFGQDH